MSNKDNRTKAELIADLEKAEQEKEALSKANESLKTESEQLKQQATQSQQSSATTDQANAAKRTGLIGASPDARTHFHSPYAKYRASIGKHGYAEFFNNHFATEDAEIIDALKKHPAFGREFNITLVPNLAA